MPYKDADDGHRITLAEGARKAAPAKRKAAKKKKATKKRKK